MMRLRAALGARSRGDRRNERRSRQETLLIASLLNSRRCSAGPRLVPAPGGGRRSGDVAAVAGPAARRGAGGAARAAARPTRGLLGKAALCSLAARAEGFCSCPGARLLIRPSVASGRGCGSGVAGGAAGGGRSCSARSALCPLPSHDRREIPPVLLPGSPLRLSFKEQQNPRDVKNKKHEAALKAWS